MSPAVLPFMRAHGLTPGPTQRPVLAGVLAGALAEFPALPVLRLSGALESLSHALGVEIGMALELHLGFAVLAGALYGSLFRRAANDRRGGWLFGLSYGFLLWTLGPVTALQWALARPVAIGRAAMGVFGSHLVYGLALGLVYPLVHTLLQRKMDEGEETRKRR